MVLIGLSLLLCFIGIFVSGMVGETKVMFGIVGFLSPGLLLLKLLWDRIKGRDDYNE